MNGEEDVLLRFQQATAELEQRQAVGKLLPLFLVWLLGSSSFTMFLIQFFLLFLLSTLLLFDSGGSLRISGGGGRHGFLQAQLKLR